jgi:hypothetical protein
MAVQTPRKFVRTSECGIDNVLSFMPILIQAFCEVFPTDSFFPERSPGYGSLRDLMSKVFPPARVRCCENMKKIAIAACLELDSD